MALRLLDRIAACCETETVYYERMDSIYARFDEYVVEVPMWDWPTYVECGPEYSTKAAYDYNCGLLLEYFYREEYNKILVEGQFKTEKHRMDQARIQLDLYNMRTYGTRNANDILKELNHEMDIPDDCKRVDKFVLIDNQSTNPYPKKHAYVRRTPEEFPPLNYNIVYCPPPFVPLRDPKLVNRLRDIIYTFAFNRLPYIVRIWRNLKLGYDRRIVKHFNYRRIVTPEGLTDWFSKKKDEVIDDTINKVDAKINEKYNNLFTKIMTDIKAVKSDISESTSSIVSNVVGHLVHTVLNPSATSFAWAIVHTLIHAGVIKMNDFATATNILLRALFAFDRSKLNAPKQESSVVFTHGLDGASEFETPFASKTRIKFATPEGPITEDAEVNKHFASYVSLIYTSVCSLLKVSTKKDFDIDTCTNMLVTDLPKIASGANSMFKFLENNGNMIRYIIEKTIGTIWPKYNALTDLEACSESIQQWAEETVELTDPQKFRDNLHIAAFQDRVFSAFTFGGIILTQLVGNIHNTKVVSIVTKLYNDLSKLKDTLVGLGRHPHVRKEPFVIWVHGDPGIGKSSLQDIISVKMLQSINYKTNKPLLCVVSPTSKYWDQCDHQPVLAVDDMFAVETGETLEQQLNMMFMVKSPIPLCPPKAAVEDKSMRYNPEIFYINSNKQGVNINGVDKTAIHRRVDFLVKARVSQHKRKDCPHCIDNVPLELVNPDFLKDMHHVEFAVFNTPRDHENGKYGPFMSFIEFIDKLIPRFQKYHEYELTRFNDRLERAFALQDTVNIDDHSVSILDKHDTLKANIVQRLVAEQENNLIDITKKSVIDWYNRSREAIAYRFVNKKVTPEIGDPVDDTNPFKDDMDEEVEDTDHIEFLSHKTVEKSLPLVVEDDIAIPSTSTGKVNGTMKHRPPFKFTRYEPIVSNIISDDVPINDSIADIPNNNTILNEISALLSDCDIIKKMNVATREEFKNLLEESKDDKNILTYVECIVNNYAKYGDRFIPPGKSENFTLGHLYPYISTDYSFSCGHGMIPFDSRTSYIYSKDKICFVSKGKCYEITGKTCKENCMFDSIFMSRIVGIYWTKLNSAINRYIKTKPDQLPAFMRSVDYKAYVVKALNFKNTIMENITHWLFETVPSCIINILTFVTKYLPIILVTFGTVFSTFELFKYNKILDNSISLQKSVEEDLKNRGSPSVKWSKPESAANYNLPSQVKTTIPKVTYMPENFTQQTEDVIRLVSNNMYYLVARHGSKVMRARILILRNRQAIILRHYIEEYKALPKGTNYFLQKFGSDVMTPIDFNNLLCNWFNGVTSTGMFASNLGLCQLPVSIPEGRNIINFIPTLSKHSYINGKGSIIQGNGTINTSLNVTREKQGNYQVGPHGNSNPVLTQDVYTYNVHARGMCGSVLLSDNLDTPIIGLHVAGCNVYNKGISEILYREMFDDSPVDKTCNYDDIVELELHPIDVSKVNLKTTLYPQGCVPPTLSHAQSGVSQYMPSLVAGTFRIQTEPNPLKSNDPRLPPGFSPLVVGCEKHGLPPMEFPKELVREATNHFTTKLLDYCVPVRDNPGLLSLSQSICGDINVPQFKCLEFNTSEGWPLSSMRPSSASNKKWLFDLESTVQGYKLKGLHPALTRQLQIEQGLRLANVKPVTVFTDCLKDACILTSKVTIPGKTRIFSISPVQYTIIFKQYFGDFMAAFEVNRANLEHAIGINVNSMEWTCLLNKLLNNNDKFIAGDYSNFGPALSAQVAHAAFECIIKWISHYTDIDTNICWILAQEILAATHLCCNLLYRVPCGIPSGSPITAPLNSIVNCLYMRIAWLSIFESNPIMRPLSIFSAHVEQVTYGDDILMTISDEALEAFNMVTLEKFFKQFNIKFTDADKSDKIIIYRNLQDITFLKHKFIPHPTRPGVWLAALDRISVEGCFNWIRRKGNLIEATKENVIQGVLLSFGNGSEYYNNLIDTLRPALKKHDIVIDFLTWEDIDRRNYSPLICIPEMESAQGIDTANVIETSNVVLVENRDTSVDIIQAPPVSSWTADCTADQIPSYHSIVDRFVVLDNFKWHKDDGVGKEISNYILPRALIDKEAENACNLPNTLPFNIHRYCNLDMEVKIHINSSKFQVGQLQISWFYGDVFDKHFSDRENVYSGSYTNHCLVTASSSNEASLVIPYKYFVPFLHTRKRKDMSNPLNLGRLFIRVLNQLSVPQDGPVECYGTLFIRFFNAHFTGMAYGGHFSHEMEFASMAASMALLNTFMPDFNRDNPPTITPATFVTVQPSHSLSVGTGQGDPINPLRLDPRGQTPHKFGVETNSCLFTEITRIFGLVTTFQWTTTHKRGDALIKFHASPILDLNTYKSYTNSGLGATTSYYMPPVAVISGVHELWRGALDFRFDIIAGQYHTGRLLIAYIPFALDSDSVTLDNARASPHVVINLQEQLQYTYVIPFISNKPWWCRRFAGDLPANESTAPSMVYVFVLNPLVNMQSVVKSVDINMYMRAGTDFELAIPVQPSFGLSFNPNVLYTSDDFLHAINKYSPYYCGHWVNFFNSTVLVFRWGTLSEQIAQFTSPFVSRKAKGYYYEIVGTNSLAYINSTNVSVSVRYALFFTFRGIVIGVPMESFQQIQALLRKKFAGTVILSWDDLSLKEFYISSTLTTSNAWSNPQDPKWLVRNIKLGTDEENYVVVDPEGERDDTTSMLIPGSSLPSSDHGNTFFGERFFSFKDLCRRYQPYASIAGKYKSPVGSLGSAICSFPILPQGLGLDIGSTDTIRPLWNRLREGVIPIIASGFRFYRGGVRFKIILISDQLVMYWVQHRPDLRYNGNVVRYPTGGFTSEFDYNHGYAGTMQWSAMNPVVEVEIPFYQPGMYGLLQENTVDDLTSRHVSLGDLSIGFLAPPTKEINYRIVVMYCMADDMQFTTFQGFPPVIVIDDFSDDKN